MQRARYTAVAILRVDGTFVLQHRDDKPTIPAPGHWSLFGGEIDPGENAHQAIRREIHEELDTLPAPMPPITIAFLERYSSSRRALKS